jgi:hypothetical protein
VEALRADPALSEPLRQAALRAVLRRETPAETTLTPRRRTTIDSSEQVELGSSASPRRSWLVLDPETVL